MIRLMILTEAAPVAFRRLLAGLTAALCLASSVSAQSLTPAATTSPKSTTSVRNVHFMKSNQASKRDMGSARILSGRVGVCHIFCFDNESYWQRNEIDRALALFNQGLRFIQDQSQLHHRQLEFVQQICRPVRINHRISTDANARPAWTEDMIDLASGRSGTALVKRLRNELAAENVLICLHVNKSALSYNLAYYDNVHAKFDAERMVCFTRYPDGRETAAATYAHEVLHLFGAGDLYFPYDRTPARKLRAAQMFPNDVMYRVDYDMQRLNIGPFTAFRVGWTDTLDAQLRMFEDR